MSIARIDRPVATIQNLQARISLAKTQAEMDRIIAEAPEEMRRRLQMHAEVVMGIRRFYESRREERTS